ncbi:MauE/DoxX family redox-associated membrane protein [Paracoccus aminophilus]|uniref:Methylamine utilization protein MauE n=1 Tax=Paracoccus aminophilus JCM 7686 TaxID=1367847 RepID=S5XV93_PARAH|nr:MauE/DoxX family redox-associated membrane protein [Paracoccus aminophilus]AGT07275.1 methylamine utilization protein mauE [Paracoccus aminophilus JCM 7686]
MQAILHEPLLTMALRVFLALLFATAALSKLSRIEEFYGVVRNFRLLPDGLSRVVAFVLPVFELAVAVGLVIRPLAVPAAAAAAALLIVFALALAINVVRGRTYIDCGCFRQGLKQPVSWLLVGRNIVLTALALAVAYLLPSVPAAGLADGFVGLMAGVLAMVLYFSASLLGGLAAAQSSTHSAKGR